MAPVSVYQCSIWIIRLRRNGVPRRMHGGVCRCIAQPKTGRIWQAAHMSSDESPEESTLEGAEVLVRSKGSGQWVAPDTRSYGSEDALETILAEQPRLIPGVSASGVAVRQLDIPGTGTTDIIVVDRSGVITLCECKLANNSEIRRKVVGQVFAYSSALWKMSYETFDAQWRKRANNRSLVDSVWGHEGSDEDRAEFEAAVGEALKLGRFRHVFAVDALTPELQRIVEYLNEHSNDDTTILALALGRAEQDGVEILIPRVYGVEAAQEKVERTKRKWDEADFWEQLQSAFPESQSAIRTLFIDRFRDRLDHYYWGEGRRSAATAAVGGEVSWYPFTVYADGWLGIAVNFEWIVPAGLDKCETLLERLSAVPEFEPYLRELRTKDFRKRPTVRWKGALEKPENLQVLSDAFDAIIP
jgi:hypothetical protein